MQVLGPMAANPLPQALILTAIVIGFALVAFAAALALKAYRAIGTRRSPANMTDAEALGSPFDKQEAANA